ncbi:P-loop containing nucleoside triphosphate hydrolase protein [Radiomyces spectabilis]|uniref:P-loop containing nucleoside triphosphate hydrolase protein n=1 Tax=Radiomyces spectabilis TaxID=64574 RepID=UPI00221F352F|nr:P-loop containing nucleoside triphosphate hydrolase protein [Radiomyces spectabilis]KAI8391647.1 P-loop containing nucleoside triphosphate hydrolase protein [Radiomyces spectabilis]
MPLPIVTAGSNAFLTPPYLSIVARRANGYSRAFSSLPDDAHGTIGGIIATIAEKLGVGELATGGLQLAVIGGTIAGFRYFGGYVLEYLKKRTIVTADFDSRDESYSWILNWLSEHPYTRNARQFSVSTSIGRAGQRVTGEGLDAMLPPVYFLPAPGIHFFVYQNRLLWLTRERPSPSSPGMVVSSNTPLERIQISTFGRTRTLLQSLVLEAQKKFIDRDLSRTVVFAADQYGAWRRTRSRPKRPLNTIVIPPNVKSRLVVDAQEFLTTEQWYSDRGIPYRRGYLLYGTPGSGKTSFVYSLAGELGLNIYVVNLSNKSMSDDTLGELVSDTPSRCILLIEDVDAAFVKRNRGDTTATNNITFSGLLNAIDGVAAQEGRILCMTTNHIEKLDSALIRPGRIDVRVHFGNATQDQAHELFTKFYPSIADISSLAKAFASKVPEGEFSMAHLQGFLMGHKGHPQTAVEQITSWVEAHRNNRGADPSTAHVEDVDENSQ